MHDNTVAKIEQNGRDIRTGLAVMIICIGLISSVFYIIYSYGTDNRDMINLNRSSISRQEGAFNQVSKQLDRIERKLDAK